MKTLLIACALALTLSACSSPKTSYTSPHEMDLISADFSSTDYKLVTESLVSSLLISPALDPKPRVVIFDIKNNTPEYLNMRLLQSKIEMLVMRSGKAQFVVAPASFQAHVDEIQRQNSGAYSEATLAKSGFMKGAKFKLEGELSSVIKANKSQRSAYYNLSMRLVSIETGEYVWASEAEIRKVTQ